AYQAAYRTDPTSAFGGVIAFNRPVDERTASAILAQQKVDVLVAPDFDADARRALEQKKSICVLACGNPAATDGVEHEVKTVGGGLLVQERDRGSTLANVRVVTRRAPTDAELRDLEFAWRVVRFVKSNAIVYARAGA